MEQTLHSIRKERLKEFEIYDTIIVIITVIRMVELYEGK